MIGRQYRLQEAGFEVFEVLEVLEASRCHVQMEKQIPVSSM
jgi:hypothetical protein